MIKNKIKFMVDRLYENMLILIEKNRNRNCNRTLCNLNVDNSNGWNRYAMIVIEHYVI